MIVNCQNNNREIADALYEPKTISTYHARFFDSDVKFHALRPCHGLFQPENKREMNTAETDGFAMDDAILAVMTPPRCVSTDKLARTVEVLYHMKVPKKPGQLPTSQRMVPHLKTRVKAAAHPRHRIPPSPRPKAKALLAGVPSLIGRAQTAVQYPAAMTKSYPTFSRTRVATRALRPRQRGRHRAAQAVFGPIRAHRP